MLTNDTSPPEVAPSNRREMLRYMERFGRWARKLTDDDLGMVVAFCANVQMAWNDGRPKPPTTAEQVEAGTVPIELPGLGAPLEPQEHYSGLTGDPVRPKEDSDASN